MMDRATLYMPGLPSLTALRSWTGFRAATPDKLPLIGPAEDPTVFLATGHEGLGITTSLGTARLLVDHLLGETHGDPHRSLSAFTDQNPSGDTMNWYGVMPAMTTCFDADLQVDHAFMTRHARWLLEKGCTASSRSAPSAKPQPSPSRKRQSILKTMVAAANGRAPIVAAISALSTSEAVALAKTAADAGCSGLMVLPPYVYRGDWRETKAHMAAIFSATPLSCMLYNNPVAYGTDFLPEQIHELAAEHPNLHAIKESSTDVRRVTAIRAIDDSRLHIFVGVDDAILEGIAAGATGWIAGLVNAFPCGIRGPLRLRHAGARKRRIRAVPLVPAPAPHGYRAQIHPAHQARSGGAGRGQCARASAAPSDLSARN